MMLIRLTWKMWEHTGWGDAMRWADYDRREITGHLTPKPKTGDVVLAKMQSGRVAQFIVKQVEHCDGVPDQFFAKVSDGQYETEANRASGTLP